jgi:hypothetical protein
MLLNDFFIRFRFLLSPEIFFSTGREGNLRRIGRGSETFTTEEGEHALFSRFLDLPKTYLPLRFPKRAPLDFMPVGEPVRLPPGTWRV